MLHVPIIVWYISKRWATSLKYNHGCLGEYVNTLQNKNGIKSVISISANSTQVFQAGLWSFDRFQRRSEW